MAVLAAVRVTSYYTEDLSRDIAKMLPFALLGIFLIDLRYFEIETTLGLLAKVGDHWENIFYYWLFIAAMELVLRITEPYFKALYNSVRNPRRASRQAANGPVDAPPENAGPAANDATPNNAIEEAGQC